MSIPGTNLAEKDNVSVLRKSPWSVARKQVNSLDSPKAMDSADMGMADAFAMVDGIASDLQSGSELNSRVSSLAEQLASIREYRQEELEEKEALAMRLSTLLKALPAGVVVLDARGNVQDCNPAAVDLLGEPLSGERWVDIISRAFAPRADDGHEVSLKDGRRLSIRTCSLENGFGQLILLSDLSETRQLQAKLAQQERLSAMGRMVASLAHQIRTPLSAAMLFAEHLLSADLEPEIRVKSARKLLSRLGHLEQQMRDMLLFAKGDAPAAETLGAGQFIQELQNAAENLMAVNEVAFHWQCADPAVRFLGNKDALVGAVMNLLNNAVEAMRGQADAELHIALEPLGNFIALTVKDNGCGFQPQESLQLAEAFHTTKANGTGLGLAVVQSVAQAHQGKFFITSSGPGNGAQANLIIPACTNPIQAVQQEVC